MATFDLRAENWLRRIVETMLKSLAGWVIVDINNKFIDLVVCKRRATLLGFVIVAIQTLKKLLFEIQSFDTT